METMDAANGHDHAETVMSEVPPTPKDTRKNPDHELLHAKILRLGENENVRDSKCESQDGSTPQIQPPTTEKARLCQN